MAGQFSSLASAISTASVPELKDILRKINSSSPLGKETITYLLGFLKSDEQNEVSALRDVVLQTCEKLEDARDIVAEALADDEEEMSYGQWLHEDVEEPGYESTRSSSPEKPASQKRKFKWKPNTVPRTEPKRMKSSQNDVKHPLETRKTIDELFAADAARRVKEEQEEIARVKEIQESMTMNLDYGIATCARCEKFFEKGENTGESCAFHSGAPRHYHEKYTGSAKWFCCGEFLGYEGCMQAKHVDIKRPGAVRELARLREKARREAAATTYGQCADCGEDVEIDENIYGDNPQPEDLLCESCIEEKQKIEVLCTGCNAEFRISPDELGDEEDDLWCEECEVLPVRGYLEDEYF